VIPRRVGVIHLLPLPGAPGAVAPHSDAHARATLRAVKEALILEKEGFDGLIIENFGDAPFFRGRVGFDTVASFSAIVQTVCTEVRVPIGVNVLRNDAETALAIAAVNGCNWIRVNVLSGMSVTDQGVVQGEAARLTRLRRETGEPIQLWADAEVKHAKGYTFERLEDEIEDLALRSGADAIILTGRATGKLTSMERLSHAHALSKEFDVPLALGSGAAADNVDQIRPLVDSVIVGSSLRVAGEAGAALDIKRVRAFVRADEKALRAQARARRKTRSR
jgi:membrane complex biogenesis BtpA family protein